MIRLEELTKEQQRKYTENALFRQCIDYLLKCGEKAIPHIIENLVDLTDIYHNREVERITKNTIVNSAQEFYD